MVHWPKSVVGNVVTIAVTLVVGLALVQSAIALSGSFVWISLAVVAYRRAQAASDLALADAPSFADVLPQWNHRRDLEAAKLKGPVDRVPTVGAGAGDDVMRRSSGAQ